MLELDSRHCRASYQSLLLTGADTLFQDQSFAKELGLVKVLLGICGGTREGEKTLEEQLAEFEFFSPTHPFMVPLMDALVSSPSSSLQAESLPHLSRIALMLTLDQSTSSSLRLLTSLLTALLASVKLLPQTQISADQPLVASSLQLVARLHSLVFSSSGQVIDASHIANLASHSYSLAALLYQAKVVSPCADLLSTSVTACTALSARDSSRKGLARPRYKLQAEVFSKLGRHKEALVSLAKGLAIAAQVRLNFNKLR